MTATLQHSELATVHLFISRRESQRAWSQLEAEFGVLELRIPLSSLFQAWVDGRALGIQQGNRVLFPGFQFDLAGDLRLSVVSILGLARQLGIRHHEIAIWYCAPCSCLYGRRPVDLIEDLVLLQDCLGRAFAPRW